MSNDPIWIIDQDLEDQDIVQSLWREMAVPNELVFLNGAAEAFDRLAAAEKAPFMIICEINLTGEDGFELRQRLLDTHSKKFKSVPFIFWSSHVSEVQVVRAYDLSVHGIFVKDGTLGEMKDTFETIIRYWRKSRMPAKVQDGE